MEKVFVVQQVAAKLFSTENAVDAAMTEAAEMMATLMQARRDAGVSAVTGDQAAVKLAEAIAALGAARSAMVACHGELDAVRAHIGVRRLKMAGWDTDKSIAKAEAAQLRDVG